MSFSQRCANYFLASQSITGQDELWRVHRMSRLLMPAISSATSALASVCQDATARTEPKPCSSYVPWLELNQMNAAETQMSNSASDGIDAYDFNQYIFECRNSGGILVLSSHPLNLTYWWTYDTPRDRVFLHPFVFISDNCRRSAKEACPLMTIISDTQPIHTNEGHQPVWVPVEMLYLSRLKILSYYVFAPTIMGGWSAQRILVDEMPWARNALPCTPHTGVGGGPSLWSQPVHEFIISLGNYNDWWHRCLDFMTSSLVPATNQIDYGRRLGMRTQIDHIPKLRYFDKPGFIAFFAFSFHPGTFEIEKQGLQVGGSWKKQSCLPGSRSNCGGTEVRRPVSTASGGSRRLQLLSVAFLQSAEQSSSVLSLNQILERLAREWFKAAFQRNYYLIALLYI